MYSVGISSSEISDDTLNLTELSPHQLKGAAGQSLKLLPRAIDKKSQTRYGGIPLVEGDGCNGQRR